MHSPKPPCFRCRRGGRRGTLRPTPFSPDARGGEASQKKMRISRK
ncbi:hypothetical protein [Azospirillum doebereinerae]